MTNSLRAPPSPAFWMNCKAICFILSRSSPFTFVYSGNCFVCLAMLRDMVRSGYSPSTNPRSLTHGQTPWYQVPVRQASDLPPTSFRPNVAIGTLTLAVRLPLLGRARDFHPLDYAHVGRTRIEPRGLLPGAPNQEGGLLLSRIALQYHRRRRA